jgi:hypothetical protein
MSETLSVVPARDPERACGSSAPKEQDDWLVEAQTVEPCALSLRARIASRQGRSAVPTQVNLVVPKGVFSVAHRLRLASGTKVLEDLLERHGQVEQSDRCSRAGRNE